MNGSQLLSGRRAFLKGSAAIAAAAAGTEALAQPAYSDDAETNIVGPKKGYSPQIGTLVSMMAFMRAQVLSSVKAVSVKGSGFSARRKGQPHRSAALASGGRGKVLPGEYL